jgi:hypothetical protein
MKQYNKHKNCKYCPNFSTDHQNVLADSQWSADHRLATDDLEFWRILQALL